MARTIRGLTRRSHPWTGQALCALAFGALLFVCGCSSEQPAPEAEVRSDSSPIIFNGHLSRDIVAPDESLRFWITVENRSAAPLENLRIDHLDTPGFKKLRWHWGSNPAAQGCANEVAPNTQPTQQGSGAAPAASAAAANDEWLLCQSLKPGESLAVWGDLSVEDSSVPPERLFAVVSWTQPPAQSGIPANAGNTSSNAAGTRLPPSPAGNAVPLLSSKTVFLGIAEPVSSLHFVTWLARPEISIPGTLTLLGLLLTFLSARRDERSKVFTAMLSSVHDAAFHYFMPMTSVLSSALLYIGNAIKEDPPGENARRGFYYMTMFHWWQRKTLNKVGAYQLTTRTGEKLLLALAGKHRDLYPRNTEAAWRRFDVILGDLEKETTLDQFLGTLDGGNDDWTKAWTDFAGWLKTDDCKKDLNFLDGFAQIMLYEVNGLHELWYGSGSPLKLSEQTRGAILEVADGDFKFGVEHYLQDAENTERILRSRN